MRIINYIAFSVFLLYVMDLNAQCPIHINTTSFCYFNGITEQNQTIDIYQITNNSKEDYLTWVSLAPINNRTNIELMHDFFKQRKGDFSWIEMMYEDLLHHQPISIGYSFIKNISPEEMFSYFIARADAKPSLYQGRIVLIKK